MRLSTVVVASAALTVVSCLPLACAIDETSPGSDEDRDAEQQPEGLPALGGGTHELDNVVIDVIATADDGLNGPRDLDFNPDVPGELWVVNRLDDSTVTIFDAGASSQESLHLIDPFALHFMEEVSSISFSTGLKFGTCQESRNTYNDQAAPDDFMGPALWSADFDVYAKSNPDAVDTLGYDLGSHLDMLHESPLCMGIAWERDNIYWTFDGLAGTISRYDFQEDHGPGFDDHSDGVIEQFIDVDVERVADVPSHMVFDHETGTVLVADTGNARILEIDPSSAELTATPRGVEPGVRLAEMEGATLRDIVPPGEHYLERPSGIALYEDLILVTENKSSTIQAFNREGEEVDYLETGLPEGALMGLRVDGNGHIWATDYVGNRVLRFRPKD